MTYHYPDNNESLTIGRIRQLNPFDGYWEKSEEYILSCFECQLQKQGRVLKTLLDIGAGDGRLSVRFSPLFQTIIALEPDETRCARAKKHTEKAAANVSVRCEDFRNVSPTNYMSDAVVLSHVIQHIAIGDAEYFLKNAYRALKPGGLLLLMTNHSRRRADTYTMLAKRQVGGSEQNTIVEECPITQADYEDLIENEAGYLPIHHFSLQHLMELFKRSHFDILDTLVFHDTGPSTVIDTYMFRDEIINATRLKRFFGRHVGVIAQKRIL